MRKRILAIVLFLLAAGICASQDEDFSKVQIKATKVAGNVYMLEGAGGNIGVSVGEDGIVIVDDQFAPLAEKIRAALKDITVKPLRFIINTHWHFDHTGSNEVFANSASIIAQENVRKRLRSGGIAGNGGSMSFESKPAPKGALPIITFRHDVTLHLNGEDIEVMHFPSGHTDGDSMVFFRQSNVVHMGDDFVTYGFPFIDVNSGGSIKGMISALEQALAQLPADVKIIPGHGPVSSTEDVRITLKMLRETTAVVEKAIAEKKTLEQMKQQKILEPWKEYSDRDAFVSPDAFIETLYNSLTGKKNVSFLKH